MLSFPFHKKAYIIFLIFFFVSFREWLFFYVFCAEGWATARLQEIFNPVILTRWYCFRLDEACAPCLRRVSGNVISLFVDEYRHEHDAYAIRQLKKQDENKKLIWRTDVFPVVLIKLFNFLFAVNLEYFLPPCAILT